MKRLIFINGTMGVGKTSTSRELQKILSNCVFLDGDWCWDMSPFIITNEAKQMVVDNISYMLNNFIACSAYDNIIFCWVMHEQRIIDDILSRINLCDYQLYKFSLVCSREALTERITLDVKEGFRTIDVLERSIPRMQNYLSMDTLKINVTDINAKYAAYKMYEYLKENDYGI